jgi:class 3 adenylate cyclase
MTQHRNNSDYGIPARMIEYEDTNTAVMFADISGSMWIYETLGETRAHMLLCSWLSSMSGIISRQQGEIIITIGDEIISTFVNVCQSVTAAIEMCNLSKTLLVIPAIETARIGLRIGLSIGHVVRQQNDIYGDAVNEAARMMSLACPGQIITDHHTVESFPIGFNVDFKYVDRIKIPREKTRSFIYEIIQK